MQVSDAFTMGLNSLGGRNDHDHDRDDRWRRPQHHRGHYQCCWNWRRFCWENRWCWDD